jgi:hypothetical protein
MKFTAFAFVGAAIATASAKPVAERQESGECQIGTLLLFEFIVLQYH